MIEKTLKIITVSNKSDNYIGGFTIEEKRIILNNIIGKTLHLFSGNSNIGDERIDFSSKIATINSDVFEYLTKHNKKYDTILLDPPYNDKYATKYAKISNIEKEKEFVIFANTPKTTELFNHIIRLNPKIIIIKCWQYYILKGYQLKIGYLCYAGGYRKPTFLLVMEKI